MRPIATAVWLVLFFFAFSAISAVNSSPAAAADSAVVQDFAKPFPVTKYPPEHKGEVAISKEYSKDGRYSLKIDAGLMVALTELDIKDWSGYSVLRLHFKNTSTQTTSLGFELTDNFTKYYDRHQNAFSLPPGEGAVDFDITGALWRGEQQGPYRGESKKPIDISKITRMAFTNEGESTIYIDKIEVVKLPKIECKGAFAFAFGRKNFPVMTQFIGVDNETLFDAARGYGMIGKSPYMISTSMAFPTPLLGNGLGFNDGGFKAVLPGGKYIGWVAFERGGFWEGSAAGYKHLALKVNGQTVHEHDFGTDAADFMFQDLELLDESQLMDKLIYPAAGAAQFKFEAANGENHFTLDLTDDSGTPPRVAGLILAPDTDAGRAFLKAHLDNQVKAFAGKLKMTDKGRRAAAGRVAPGSALVVQTLQPGEDVYPHDWPKTADNKMPGKIVALAGQKVVMQLGLYAQAPCDVTVTAAPLTGPGELKVSEISHGRYLPQRPYGTGICWLEVHHYRPEPTFKIGPDLARPLLVEFDVPADAKAGTYTGQVQIKAKIGDGQTPGPVVTVPVIIDVQSVKLPAIPIPVALFKNSLQIGPETIGADRYWQLQEELLAEQSRAGLNMTTGGVGLGIQYVKQGGKYTFEGENAIKYLALAAKYGMDKAFTNYGGYWALHGFKGDAAALAEAWSQFASANHLPPFYLYSYDEPRVQEDYDHLLPVMREVAKTSLHMIGYTSEHRGNKDWDELIALSYAPAFNDHSAETFKKYPGKEIWCYNNGLDRYSFGIDLWRKIQLGCKGRLQWIGLYEQGFAFDNLDGREPSYCCFKVHKTLGIMKTNLWLSAREGLLDCRIRLALEAKAPKDDPALKLWTLDGYRQDKQQWPDDKLQSVREAMLKRLAELGK